MKAVSGALCVILAGAMIAGCSDRSSYLPSSGANRYDISNPSPQPGAPAIALVDVTDSVARALVAGEKRSLFSETLGADAPSGYLVGAGDVVEVTLWEAPPATLFGGKVIALGDSLSTATMTTFPQQMVSSDGTINVPFAGAVPAAGRLPRDIEADIARRLQGKANQPQVMVRVIHNTTSNVTVVGEVASSTRMPLTAKGERLLDALAAAGGVRQPVGKTTVQVTRGEQVHALPLDTIIRDPKQNVVLRPGDVVTVMHQPLSFTVLGATGKNQEIDFEGQGISLAQALARAGGLQDARADAKGVFLFRFEDPRVIGFTGRVQTTADGRVPVVYRVDLKDPASFFAAQNFPVRNKDVLYVADAPVVELQKFLGIVNSLFYPAVNVFYMTQ